MKQNDTLRNVLFAAAIFIVVMAIMPRLMPAPKSPPPASSPASTSVAPSEKTAMAPGTASPVGTTTRDGATVESGFSTIEAAEVETVVIGADQIEKNDKDAGESSLYRMRLTLSNVGASVDSATMTDHAEEAGGVERYQLLAPLDLGETRYRSLTIEKVNIDGVDVVVGDKRWHVLRGAENYPATANSEQGMFAEFSIDIQRDGAPIVRLIRTFSLPQQTEESGRHDLYSELRAINLSDAPHQILVEYHGGLGIRRIDPRADDRFIDVGIRGESNSVSGARKSLTDLAKSPGFTLPLFSSASNPKDTLSWAAVENTYFTCTIAPLNRAGDGPADYVAAVSAFDADRSLATDRDTSVRIVTVTDTLVPKGELSYRADIYLGDKDGHAFKNVSVYGVRNYYFQVAQGFGYCTFSWLVTLMIGLLNTVYRIIPDYGIAIIVLVLIVRALLHPITKKGQVNMVRMQSRMAELAPKMDEIKKKYANDKVRMSQEIQKLGLNPAGQLLTCLPMFIQLPIWAALYLSLSHNIAMRHEPFLFTWIRDLTAQDALIPFSTPFLIPIVGWELTSFNLLPILVSITMYIQQKLQPKPKPNPNMTDEQRMQQDMMMKMMPMMSIMMLFIFYKMPSGLNLYVMTSSIFGSIEQWYIRKHIREREDAGTLHKPIKVKVTPEPGAPPRAMPAWLEKLQRMAEDAKKTRGPAHKAKPRR